MSRQAFALAVLTALGPAGAAAQEAPAATLARAESLLAGGQFQAAERLARTIVARDRGSVNGRVVLGRALLARATSNLPRLRALDVLREASRLAPTDTAVWHALVEAGLALGGADGERVLSEAAERLIALSPEDASAWRSWRSVYRSERDRERVRRLVAPYAQLPEVSAQVARLFVEDARYDEANAHLSSLLSRDSTRPDWLALRAQSALEFGNSSEGYRFYWRAVAAASRDSSGLLWEQVVGIATPDEVRAWEAMSGGEARAEFLRAFWRRRTPSLFDDADGRIAEHFARLREARRRYPLLHPLVGYQSRPESRGLQLTPSAAEEVFYQRCEARTFPGGPVRADDQARMPLTTTDGVPVAGGAEYVITVPYPGSLLIDARNSAPVVLVWASPARDLRDVDSTAARIGYNRLSGLDDRGLTYLRHGAPRRRTIGPANVEDPFCAIRDVEVWEYDGIGAVRFFRPSAVSITGASTADRQTGDIVFRPMQQRQFEAMAAVMTRDATSVPAPLEFGTWFAQFASEVPGYTEVAVITTARSVAATAVTQANGRVEHGESGRTVLPVQPGRQELLIHASQGGQLGRNHLVLRVRDFADLPALSDLLLAPAWSGREVTRAAMLDRAAGALAFEEGRPIRVYAEVYGLAAASGRRRFHVSYIVARTTDAGRDLQRDSLPGAMSIAFDREHPADGAFQPEWVDIAPERLPSGRYVLRLAITDTVSGTSLGYAQAAFVVLPH